MTRSRSDPLQHGLRNVVRALRRTTQPSTDRERGTRQLERYVRRLSATALVFAELGRRVRRLSTELGMDVRAALDATAIKAIAEAAEMARQLGRHVETP
jgi:hypothetical protein